MMRLKNSEIKDKEVQNQSSKMNSCSFSLHIARALPSPSPPHSNAPLRIVSKQKQNSKIHLPKRNSEIRVKTDDYFGAKQAGLAIQLGAILATFENPALAVTGVNNELELTSVVIQLGFVAVFYFLIMPPIIMNWLRIRWYRRKLLEMYFQFMFVFIFFPGLLLWAPFLNFRKFPRDPDMKYPWDKPKDPSKIKNAYLRFPFAEPEDYA